MRYGIVVAAVAVFVFAVLALVAYYVKCRIDIMRQEAARQEINRTQEANAREVDRRILMDEVRAGREQMMKHMDLDRKEKDRLTRTLGSMVAEIRAHVKVLDGLSEKIDSHCDKSEQRVIRLYNKLDEIHREVIKEGHHGPS